jgi:hypothetical protein
VYKPIEFRNNMTHETRAGGIRLPQWLWEAITVAAEVEQVSVNSVMRQRLEQSFLSCAQDGQILTDSKQMVTTR